MLCGVLVDVMFCVVYIYMKIVQYLKGNVLMILVIQHWPMSDDVDIIGDLKSWWRD